MNSDYPKYFVFIFITVILLAGCQSPVEQPVNNNKLSVTCMLLSDTLSEQKIYVFNTSPFEDKIWSDNFYADAQVYLTDSISNFTLFPCVRDTVDNVVYYCSQTKAPFLPERKYYLTVKTSLGNITGQTQLPGDFNITSHNAIDTLVIPPNTTKDFELNWTESKGAYGYIIDFWEGREVELNGNIYNEGGGGSYMTHDLCYSFQISNITSKLKVISHTVVIRIIAFDKNYYDHHYNMNSSAGLKGGFGYFASGVLKTVTFIVK